MSFTKSFDLIENYIYIYQLDKYLILPVWPEQVMDNLGSTFSETNILARTAPIFTYSNSGPRSVQFNFQLHRDLMYSLNRNNTKFLNVDQSEFSPTVIKITDDYVDVLIKYLQAMALPSYAANTVSSKMVNPPMVAVRLGNEVFIKGVVRGDVSVTYSGPIDDNLKYQVVSIGFNVLEVDPQDAESIAKQGSFRGLETVLTRHMKR